MLISCDIGEEHSIYSKLYEIPEIKNCLITYGSYVTDLVGWNLHRFNAWSVD